jgi:hypothetical protein
MRMNMEINPLLIPIVALVSGTAMVVAIVGYRPLVQRA